MKILEVLVVLFSTFLVICYGIETDILVQTQQGSIRGTTLTSQRSNRTFFTFMGIPYAKPPVEHLWFKWPDIRAVSEFFPTVDVIAPEGEVFLPDMPRQLLNGGQVCKIPYIAGLTSNEGIVLLKDSTDLLFREANPTEEWEKSAIAAFKRNGLDFKRMVEDDTISD